MDRFNYASIDNTTKALALELDSLGGGDAVLGGFEVNVVVDDRPSHRTSSSTMRGAVEKEDRVLWVHGKTIGIRDAALPKSRPAAETMSYVNVTSTFKLQHIIDNYDLLKDRSKLLVDWLLNGFNACVLAYGPRNTGKSITFFGVPVPISLNNALPERTSLQGQAEPSLVLYVLRQLYDEMGLPRHANSPRYHHQKLTNNSHQSLTKTGWKTGGIHSPTRKSGNAKVNSKPEEGLDELATDDIGTISLSVWMLQGNTVTDLCASESTAISNRDDFTSVNCRSLDEALAVIHASRSKAQGCLPLMSQQRVNTSESTRGHFFLRVVIHRPSPKGVGVTIDEGQPLMSHIHFVDLIGTAPTDADPQYQRMRENDKIARRSTSLQLQALVRVLQEMKAKARETSLLNPATRATDRQRNAPTYTSARDSKLTSMLAPLLQGNCKTCLYAFIRDGQENHRQTAEVLSLCEGMTEVMSACHRVSGVPKSALRLKAASHVIPVHTDFKNKDDDIFAMQASKDNVYSYQSLAEFNNSTNDDDSSNSASRFKDLDLTALASMHSDVFRSSSGSGEEGSDDNQNKSAGTFYSSTQGGSPHSSLHSPRSFSQSPKRSPTKSHVPEKYRPVYSPTVVSNRSRKVQSIMSDFHTLMEASERGRRSADAHSRLVSGTLPKQKPKERSGDFRHANPDNASVLVAHQDIHMEQMLAHVPKEKRSPVRDVTRPFPSPYGSQGGEEQRGADVLSSRTNSHHHTQDLSFSHSDGERDEISNVHSPTQAETQSYLQYISTNARSQGDDGDNQAPAATNNNINTNTGKESPSTSALAASDAVVDSSPQHESPNTSISGKHITIDVNVKIHDDFEKQLRDIYTEYNPDKLDNIPTLLDKFKGREDVLLGNLYHKYDIADHHRHLFGHIDEVAKDDPVETGEADTSGTSNVQPITTTNTNTEYDPVHNLNKQLDRYRKEDGTLNFSNMADVTSTTTYQSPPSKSIDTGTGISTLQLSAAGKRALSISKDFANSQQDTSNISLEMLANPATELVTPRKGASNNDNPKNAPVTDKMDHVLQQTASEEANMSEVDILKRNCGALLEALAIERSGREKAQESLLAVQTETSEYRAQLDVSLEDKKLECVGLKKQLRVLVGDKSLEDVYETFEAQTRRLENEVRLLRNRNMELEFKLEESSVKAANLTNAIESNHNFGDRERKSGSVRFQETEDSVFEAAIQGSKRAADAVQASVFQAALKGRNANQHLRRLAHENDELHREMDGLRTLERKYVMGLRITEDSGRRLKQSLKQTAHLQELLSAEKAAHDKKKEDLKAIIEDTREMHLSEKQLKEERAALLEELTDLRAQIKDHDDERRRVLMVDQYAVPLDQREMPDLLPTDSHGNGNKLKSKITIANRLEEAMAELHDFIMQTNPNLLPALRKVGNEIHFERTRHLEERAKLLKSVYPLSSEKEELSGTHAEEKTDIPIRRAMYADESPQKRNDMPPQHHSPVRRPRSRSPKKDKVSSQDVNYYDSLAVFRAVRERRLEAEKVRNEKYPSANHSKVQWNNVGF